MAKKLDFFFWAIPGAVSSPESLDVSQIYGFTALEFISDTIPERKEVMYDSRKSMLVPVTFDFFHKLGVFFPFFMKDFKDVEGKCDSTSKATRDILLLLLLFGTG